jgi:hypothetical protein
MNDLHSKSIRFNFKAKKGSYKKIDKRIEKLNEKYQWRGKKEESSQIV